MSRNNSGKIDLNLLLVFEAIMEQRSVTQAAARLAVTQAAVSHSLAKLRRLLDDELFVRTADGMTPTPRAIELSGPIRESLAQIATALDSGPFDPARSAHTFKFAMSDYFAALVLPPLVRRVEREAPNVDIRVVSHRAANVHDLLETQEIDFAIGLFRERPASTASRFSYLTLFEESYACLMRRDHPLARSRLTLREFVGARHLHVSIAGEEMGALDRTLQSMQLKRRVALSLTYFSGAPLIIKNSDMIMTLASRMARVLSRQYGLRAVPVPLQVPRAPLRLVGHDRFGRHPANRWMWAIIADIGAELARNADGKRDRLARRSNARTPLSPMA